MNTAGIDVAHGRPWRWPSAPRRSSARSASHNTPSGHAALISLARCAGGAGVPEATGSYHLTWRWPSMRPGWRSWCSTPRPPSALPRPCRRATRAMRSMPARAGAVRPAHAVRAGGARRPRGAGAACLFTALGGVVVDRTRAKNQPTPCCSTTTPAVVLEDAPEHPPVHRPD